MAEEERLSSSTRETLKNFVLALIHRQEDFNPKPDLERVIDNMEEMINKAPALFRAGIILIIKSLEMAPLAQGYRHTFSNLPPEKQEEYLYKMERSSNYAFRGIIALIKTLTLANYFCEPEAEQAVGFDGKCLLEVKGGGLKENILPDDFITH